MSVRLSNDHPGPREVLFSWVSCDTKGCGRVTTHMERRQTKERARIVASANGWGYMESTDADTCRECMDIARATQSPALYAQAAGRIKRGWIDFEDNQPTEEGKYLTNGDNGVRIGVWDGEEWTGDYALHTIYVSHWMPLPEPPE